MEYYYECKRCLYRSTQLGGMKKHLTRLNKCQKVDPSNELDDEQIYNMSIEKKFVKDDNSNELLCGNCNKNFPTKNILNKHVKTCCDEIKEDIKNENISSDVNNSETENNSEPNPYGFEPGKPVQLEK